MLMGWTVRGMLLEAVARQAVAAKLLSLSGLFAVYKPKGPTSASVLNQLKAKLLSEAGLLDPSRNRIPHSLKIGHGGILDSAATGVLVVGIGKGTKMLGDMLAGSKKYTAIGELGNATDTFDSTGKVTEEKPYDWITQEDLENVLQKFTGSIIQAPPLYSALKKGGQRLSTLVKKGVAVEAKPPRPVTVYSLALKNFKPPLFTLDVECGGGFYVRSLVNDIGKAGFLPVCPLSGPSPPTLHLTATPLCHLGSAHQYISVSSVLGAVLLCVCAGADPNQTGTFYTGRTCPL
ncbi:pseudouridylate synthase TRUB1 isoform X2 [Tiliqua scincoides]|uniref:pseudouridylate synthase TRUB1 isoform X2 n=1 Tax=Tiliqua scincoides TaxID=71010 RepID=UPI003462204F